jgi:hypothetical protein
VVKICDGRTKPVRVYSSLAPLKQENIDFRTFYVIKRLTNLQLLTITVIKYLCQVKILAKIKI